MTMNNYGLDAPGHDTWTTGATLLTKAGVVTTRHYLTRPVVNVSGETIRSIKKMGASKPFLETGGGLFAGDIEEMGIGGGGLTVSFASEIETIAPRLSHDTFVFDARDARDSGEGRVMTGFWHSHGPWSSTKISMPDINCGAEMVGSSSRPLRRFVEIIAAPRKVDVGSRLDHVERGWKEPQLAAWIVGRDGDDFYLTEATINIVEAPSIPASERVASEARDARAHARSLREQAKRIEAGAELMARAEHGRRLAEESARLRAASARRAEAEAERWLASPESKLAPSKAVVAGDAVASPGMTPPRLSELVQSHPTARR